MGYKVFGDRLHSLGNVAFTRFDMNLRILGRLVWGGYTGEFFDFPGTSFLIQALGVALLDDAEWSIYENFDEAKVSFLVQLADGFPVYTIRRYESRDGEAARIAEQLGHLSDTPNVFHSGVFVKAEIFVETEADVVSVEAVGKPALVQQGLLKSTCDGGLAAGTETSQPDRDTLLLE